MSPENLFKSVFRFSPNPIIIIKPDINGYTITEVNEAFCRVNKKVREEISGKRFAEVFSSQADLGGSPQNLYISGLDRVRVTGKEYTTPVFKYILGEGRAKRRYIRCHLAPIMDDNGVVEYIASTAIDVTERLRADRELRKTFQRILIAQQIAKTGYWERDLVRDQIFWTDEVYAIMGIKKDCSPPDFDYFFSRVHDEDKAAYIAQRTATLSGEQSMNIRMRIIQPSGRIKWVHQVGHLVKNSRGKSVAFRGVIKDITDTKALELSLEESNERYQHLSKATFDTVYEWDVENARFRWTEGYMENFGYSPAEQARPDFWTNLVHPDEVLNVRKRLKEAMMSDVHLISNEYRFKKSDGNYVNVVDRCIFIRDANGKAVRMIGAIQDVTEKKNLEKLLSKSNQLAKIGSWAIDVQTNSVYWSDVTKEIREVPQDFVPTLDKGISKFIDKPTRQLVRLRMKEAIEKGISWQEDVQIVTEKGNVKWVRSIGEPEMANGRCIKIVGSFQDIDEIKKTEIEVRRLLDEKIQILESIGDAFIRIEKDWTVTYWNTVAEREMRTLRSNIINKKLWDVFPTGLNSLTHKKFERAFETMRRVDFEAYFDLFDKWLQVNVYPSETGLSVFFRDITEQKLSQLRIQESEERYSELFRLNPHPICIFEADTFRLIQVNEAASEMYGYTEKELLEMKLTDLMPLQTVPVFTRELSKRNEGDGYMSGRFRNRTKAGEIKLVEMQSKWINIRGIKYRLAIITDITRTVRTEQAITRAIIQTQENERYEIGAELHDNVCQILASTFISLGVVSPSVDKYGQTLFNQCREYVHLATQEIRNLSHRLAPASINKTTLKDSIEALIATTNIEEKYNIVLFIDDKLNELEMCKELQLNLYRILQEQLRNIIKYAQCKKIDIGLIRHNEKITMRIEDDGVGFNPHEVKEGIGISNMRRRTELFEGKFEIISSPGQGCELTVTIPLRKPQINALNKERTTVINR